MNAARLITEGRLKIRVAPLDTLHLDNSWRTVFLPLGFTQIAEPRMLAPSYPLGYPLHLALLGMAGGWNHAPFYVTPLLALLTVIVLYKLALEFALQQEHALSAAVALAVSPAWLFMAFQPMSDVIAACWCALTMLCAMRSSRDLRWTIACGAAFGIAVWVRPTNLLLAPAIGFAFRWNARRLAVAVAASAPFAIALMITNHAMYGKAATTGYGDIGSIMTWGSCAPHHALWMAITMTPLVFPAGLLIAFNPRVPLWQRMTLLTWFVTFFAFYSAYAICDAWWYLRFLLPAYPPILIASLLLFRDFIPRRPVRIALVAAIVITGMALTRHFDLQHVHDGQKTDMHSIHWAQKQLPKNALVVTMQMSGSYYYYTHTLTARYDYLEPEKFEEMKAYVGNAGLDWYALVYDWEEKDLLKHMPGRWVRLHQMRDVYLEKLVQ